MAGLANLSGSLKASFSPDASRGVSTCVASVPPLELRGPFLRGGPPTYYLRNATAGVLDGDSYKIALSVSRGARVHVAASSASKIFAGWSAMEVTLHAGLDSLLVWGPHSTILHAGADYRQGTRANLSPGGRIVLADVLVLGRLARGERCEFARVESALDVTGPEGATMYSEASAICPSLDLNASVGGHGVLASVFALGFDAKCAGRAFERAFGGHGYGGWSELPNGCGVVGRLLANHLSDGLNLCDDLLTRLMEQHASSRAS